MDTRTKIVTAERAAGLLGNAERPVRVVTGFFDPLLAGHARRLEELASPGWSLVAVVRTPESPLLPARARAELVAGIAVVDLVVIEDGSDALARIGAAEVVREEAADERRARDFAAHVRGRY